MNQGSVDGTSATARAQLREAIELLAAEMTTGCLVTQQQPAPQGTGNSSPTATTIPAGLQASVGVHVPASARLHALLDSSRKMKEMLAELEAAEVGTAAADTLRRCRVPIASSVDASPSGTSRAANNNSSAAGAGGGNRTAKQLELTAPLLAVRAWNSQKKFAELCELSLKPASSSSASGATTTSSKESPVPPIAQAAFLAYGEPNPPRSTSSGAAAANASVPPTDAAQRDTALKPLTTLQTAFRELEKCKGFTYEEEIRKLGQSSFSGGEHGIAGGGAPSSTAMTVKHLPALVNRMTEVLAELKHQYHHPTSAPAAVKLAQSHGNGSKKSASAVASTRMPSLVSPEHAKKLFATVATWPQPLLRLLNEVLQAPTLESLTEDAQERLRRAAFDVEELAHAQEQAVTDGDMHKSEDLYFQQTELLESMKPLFDKLEASMELYERQQVERPREQLRELQRQFTSLYQETLRKEEKEFAKAQQDLEKLKAQRYKIAQVRQQQQAGLSLYQQEWQRLYEGNVRQQEECFKAMEQLEARVRELAQEQQFLVTDRVEHLSQAREAAEAAAAFDYFADAHGAALQSTAQELAVLVDGLKQVGAAVEFGCGHFDAYLRDVLGEHVAQELLATRKKRLEQFRTLYLTLGDLEFKKSRHADEIAKKVEYYNLQQEIAMDALNPKAKEFSQARQKWEMVLKEVNNQLHSIEARTQQQIEDFRPTERLLLEAGVSFVHPAEELQRRNQARQQKLLEYKELMNSRVSGNRGVDEAGTMEGNAAMAGERTAADILAEDMRMFARHAPRLQSTEEGNPTSSTVSKTAGSGPSSAFYAAAAANHGTGRAGRGK